MHSLQAKTQADPQLTVLSLDISAADDTISREAMLSVISLIAAVPDASALPPFARLWYARESVYVWTAGSHSHRVTQAEGGEQGDPLMPALFSLAFAPALRDLQADVRADEDARRSWMTHTSSPRRAAGSAPPQPCQNSHVDQRRGPAGRHPFACPTEETWVGDHALDLARRGMVAPRVPLGTPQFVEAHLQALLTKQKGPPSPTPCPGRHSGGLIAIIVLCCPTCPIRDAAVLACLDALLHVNEAVGLPALAASRAQLALRHGGLGLRSAERHAVPAYWASWVDALPALSRRDPEFSRALTMSVGGVRSPTACRLREAPASVQAVGFEPSLWSGTHSHAPCTG